MRPFFHSSEWFKARFGGRMQKIPVDAGFSCPNLDGTLSNKGCLYCSNSSFSPFYTDKQKSINDQLSRGIEYFSKRYRCSGFFAYFQNFSCTYASVDVLRAKFSEALALPEISGLVIATRPDCIDEDKLKLLAELGMNKFIMLELGIESFSDTTLSAINRCHDAATSLKCIRACVDAKITTGIHLIFGLPNEQPDYIKTAARISSEAGISMIKLHHLQIVKGSAMAEKFQTMPLSINLPSLSQFVENVCIFLAHLSPEIAIDRLINRVPLQQLIAPIFNVKNEAEFQSIITSRLQELDLWQGRFSGANC